MIRCLKTFFAAIAVMAFVLPHSLQAFELHDSLFEKDDNGVRISMDFKDAQLVDVLKAFSQQSGMNFISSSEIQGVKVNLYLDQVPVERALEQILSANGLTYELDADSNIFRVKKVEAAEKKLMTRVYYLQHASVSVSRIGQTLDFGSDEDSESALSFEDPFTETGTSFDEGSGLLAAVKSVLSQDGQVVEDERTNSLVITDYPSQFTIIESTIARLDVKIPQIAIEVEMLDISKEAIDNLGLDYGQSAASFAGAAKSIDFPFSSSKGLGTSTFDVGTLSFSELKFTMDFLRRNTDVRSLARPKILTLNNQTAEIRIATEEAIALNTNQTSADGLATATTEAERVQTGVFLRVTPQINPNGQEITMAIEPKVVQAKDGTTFNGQSVKDPETRGTKSILRVKNSETIILGGLLRNEETNTKTGLPGLSKIPILGMAFRGKDKTVEQRELLVFITPQIIEEGMTVPSGSISSKPMTSSDSVMSKRMKEIDRELSVFDR